MEQAESKGWSRVALLRVGGLTEIGFSRHERFVLAVSWNGRGVVDTITGEVVARDPEGPTAEVSWLNERTRTVLGIGPMLDVPVVCVGLWGGELPLQRGGAHLEVSPSGAEVRLRNLLTGESSVVQRPINEMRVVGFSPSGAIAVIATSSDLEILRRAG